VDARLRGHDGGLLATDLFHAFPTHHTSLPLAGTPEARRGKAVIEAEELRAMGAERRRVDLARAASQRPPGSTWNRCPAPLQSAAGARARVLL